VERSQGSLTTVLAFESSQLLFKHLTFVVALEFESSLLAWIKQ
jgi:hypothetical protein